MIFIPVNKQVKVEWTLLRVGSKEKEDFSGASVKVLLLSCNDKTPLPFEIENNVLKITISASLMTAGVYGLKVLWAKDGMFEKRAMAIKAELLNVSSNNADFDTACTVKITSHTATYGYDGMSAYEIAYVRGKTTLSESEWVYSAEDMSQKYNAIKADYTLKQSAIETAIAGANTATSNASTAANNANTKAGLVDKFLNGGATKTENLVKCHYVIGQNGVIGMTDSQNAHYVFGSFVTTEKDERIEVTCSPTTSYKVYSVANGLVQGQTANEVTPYTDENGHVRIVAPGNYIILPTYTNDVTVVSSVTVKHWFEGAYAAEKSFAENEAVREANESERIAQASSDHSRAESDHSTATGDHSIAAGDHSTATGDHSTATSDHSTATSDHSTATADSQQASSDHTASVSATSAANSAATSANQAAQETRLNEGAITDSAGDNTRWGKYYSNEGDADSSTAGDGTRWGVFKSKEAARDAAISAVTEYETKVDDLELKVGRFTLNVDNESTTEDKPILGSMDNPTPVNGKFIINISALSGNGLRICLIYKTGNHQFFAPSLGENIYNQSNNVTGYYMYHKANSGVLVVDADITYTTGLTYKVDDISSKIPSSASDINKLVDSASALVHDDIIDSLSYTEKGKVLDASKGKELNDIINIAIEDEFVPMQDLVLVQGYWNKDAGNSNDGSSAGARHRTEKIAVNKGEKYLISGVVSSMATCLVYLFGGSQEGARCVGTGTPVTYTDYELIIPDGCTHIGCQSNDPVSNLVVKKATKTFKAYTKQEADARFGTSGNAGLLYKTTETIHLGNNIVSDNFTLTDGWSGDNTTGYTHSSGLNAITLNLRTTNNDVYLFEADVNITDTTIEFCTAKFGDNPPCLTYNGTNHISVPILSDGGTFILTPVTTKTFVLSNISLRKVSNEGVEKILDLYNIISSNHIKNYGFWNVLLGASSAQNAVGSTRTIAIGNFALNALKSGNRNIAIGTYSMNEMNNGENNIAIGADAMEYVKSAQNCIAIGKGIMGTGKAISNNIAIGNGCINGSSTSESSYNVGIGFDAGYTITGQSNTCIGYKAGENIGNGGANVAIGRSVSIGSGTNRNTCVGDRSSTAIGVSDSIALGTLASATKSNQMVLGSNNITEVIIAGKKISFNENGSVTWSSV